MLIDDTISKRVGTSSWYHVLPQGITPDCVIISGINVAVEVIVSARGSRREQPSTEG